MAKQTFMIENTISFCISIEILFEFHHIAKSLNMNMYFQHTHKMQDTNTHTLRI